MNWLRCYLTDRKLVGSVATRLLIMILMAIFPVIVPLPGATEPMSVRVLLPAVFATLTSLTLSETLGWIYHSSPSRHTLLRTIVWLIELPVLFFAIALLWAETHGKGVTAILLLALGAAYFCDFAIRTWGWAISLIVGVTAVIVPWRSVTESLYTLLFVIGASVFCVGAVLYLVAPLLLSWRNRGSFDSGSTVHGT